MEHAHSHDGIEDGWPWNCTRCGTTIYHDAATCRECDRSERTAGVVPHADGIVASWVGWTRRQSYPSYVAAVATVAGIELTLSWLLVWVLTYGVPTVPARLPV